MLAAGETDRLRGGSRSFFGWIFRAESFFYASVCAYRVSGEGNAELLEDGSIEIEFEYDSGDEAVLKAKRDGFSTAC
jgi:hypothetical protein